MTHRGDRDHGGVYGGRGELASISSFYDGHLHADHQTRPWKQIHHHC